MSTTLTSYDTGSKPFKPDISRGKWSSLIDFYAVSITHSFGIKSFSIISMYAIFTCGILFIIPFILGLFIISLPIYFIQSFMGQFSSSSFISSYRIAPLFKGAGYTILVMNLASICYTVVLGSYTLVYFFASFSPELPWMTCNNDWNTHNCTVVQKFDTNHSMVYQESWAAIEYYLYALREIPHDLDSHLVVVSWRILLSSIIMWILTVAITLQGVEFIGKLLRYFCYIILGCILVQFLRILFMEKSLHFLLTFLWPEVAYFHIVEYIVYAVILSISLFGAGGGTVLTIASYNNFHSDIRVYSWINSIILLSLTAIIGIWAVIVEDHLSEKFNFKLYYYDAAELQLPFIAAPFFFGTIEISNFWSMIFYLMLFLSELAGCVVQLLSIFTSIFDEYEMLRTYKKGVIIVTSFFLFLFSIFFATNEGTQLIPHLFNASAISLTVISFLDIMIIVWFYGRERFQRDVQFLLQGKLYRTWEFMMLRFITPPLVLFLIFLNIVIYISSILYDQQVWDTLIVSIVVKFLPLLLIFIWIVYKMKISTGTIFNRFKSLCIPNDWYPVDPGDKRKYEDVIGACAENFRELFTNIEIEDDECDEE